MPTRDRVQAFVALVEAARYVEALEAFYHPDATMEDNQDPPRVGRELLIADETATMARFSSMTTDPVTDLLIDGDKVMIRWKFAFAGPDTAPLNLEEISLQRWSGDRIAEERFFFDPRQTRPPRPA